MTNQSDITLKKTREEIWGFFKMIPFQTIHRIKNFVVSLTTSNFTEPVIHIEPAPWTAKKPHLMK